MNTLNSTSSRIFLYDFVNALTAGLLPLAVDRKSLIINEIDRRLELDIDEHMLAYVLWNLLNRVIHSTQEECIHVESIVESGRAMIRVRNAGTYFYRTVSQGFRQVQQVAEQLGGSISIDQSADHGTSVALTLRYDLYAA
jgi:signal transduction histidine kinase